MNNNDLFKITLEEKLQVLPEDSEIESENYVSSKLTDNQNVKFIGIISAVRTKVTKNNEIMAFITIEDLDGSIPVTVFAKTYSAYRNLIEVDSIVKIDGRVNIREDELSIIALKFSNCVEQKYTIVIPQNLSKESLDELREYIKKLGNERANTAINLMVNMLIKT